MASICRKGQRQRLLEQSKSTSSCSPSCPNLAGVGSMVLVSAIAQGEALAETGVGSRGLSTGSLCCRHCPKDIQDREGRPELRCRLDLSWRCFSEKSTRCPLSQISRTFATKPPALKPPVDFCRNTYSKKSEFRDRYLRLKVFHIPVRARDRAGSSILKRTASAAGCRHRASCHHRDWPWQSPNRI